MRLLETKTGQFVEKDPEKTEYAILSHTWDSKGEQTYDELKKIQRRYELGPRVPKVYRRLMELRSKVFRHSIWNDPDLSPKIREACKVARENSYDYIWIDSCCIDKSSSSELSEAINSMYKWYRLAAVCYAYLADIPPGADHHAESSAFRKSRWFKRGWTLQELIAPGRVEFLSKDWAPIGSKHALVNLVESVTSINVRALLHWKPLDEFSVAQRLSWAANRETTRVEDRAYSLLGIFDINMPTLYGEGDRAFRRLQEQIMQRVPDQSLFAWGRIYLPGSRVPSDHIPTQNGITLIPVPPGDNPSANSPDAFQNGRDIQCAQLPASLRHELEYRLTPYGIRAEFQMIPLTLDLLSAIIPHQGVDLKFKLGKDFRWYLAILGCEYVEHSGHRFGRVCYIPSSGSEVDFIMMYHGFIDFDEIESRGPEPELFPLSPEIIEQFRPQTELKTVYISHPQSSRTNSDSLRSLRHHPYTTIKLVLLTETRDALHSRGYEANLRDPDPDHPTSHWLTLSKDEHMITVEFRHTLEDDGREFTIDAEVKMSGSRSQLDNAPDSDQAGRTVSWRDSCRGPWYWNSLNHRTVRLSAGGARTLTLDLSLVFAGKGFYFVLVEVQRDAPPASQDVESILPVSGSAVESAGDKGKEVGLSGDDSHSGAIDMEDSEADSGAGEIVPREARDVEGASDEARDGDGGST